MLQAERRLPWPGTLSARVRCQHPPSVAWHRRSESPSARKGTRLTLAVTAEGVSPVCLDHEEPQEHRLQFVKAKGLGEPWRTRRTGSWSAISSKAG